LEIFVSFSRLHALFSDQIEIFWDYNKLFSYDSFLYKIILKKVHHDSFLRGELMKLTEAKLPNSYNSSLIFHTRENLLQRSPESVV